MTARSEAPASFRSSSVSPGSLGLIADGIRELLSRRRLIQYMVRADIRKSGADTLLGNVWWVVDPLIQMLIYSVLVTLIFDRQVEDYGLFVFSAILPWKWFEATVKDGVSAITSQERLIKQIYFPKLVLPVAAVSAGIVNFAFGLIPLVGLTILLYGHRLSPWLLLIPVVAAVQLVFSLSVAIALSAANVFYRDVGNLARHLLRFWFYLSPTLYSPAVILNSEFVTALQAKGMSDRQILRHVLKNAAPTCLAVMGLQAGNLIGGSILIETVFAWPGTGFLLNSAIFRRDLPILQGTTLVLAGFFMLLNLTVDVIQTMVDPRIKRG